MSDPAATRGRKRGILALAVAGCLVVASLVLRDPVYQRESQVQRHDFESTRDSGASGPTLPTLVRSGLTRPGAPPADPGEYQHGEPAAGVTIRVRDQGGEPIEGATVRIRRHGAGEWHSDTTGRHGTVVLRRVHPGWAAVVRVDSETHARYRCTGELGSLVDVVLMAGVEVVLRMSGASSGLEFPLEVVCSAHDGVISGVAYSRELPLGRTVSKTLHVVRIGQFQPPTPWIFDLPSKGVVGIDVELPECGVLVLRDPALAPSAHVIVHRLTRLSGSALRVVGQASAEGSFMQVSLFGAGTFAYYATSPGAYAYGEFRLSGVGGERVRRDLTWLPTSQVEVHPSEGHRLLDVKASVVTHPDGSGNTGSPGIKVRVQTFGDAASVGETAECHVPDSLNGDPGLFELQVLERMGNGSFLIKNAPVGATLLVRAKVEGWGWIRRRVKVPSPSRKGILQIRPSGVRVALVFSELSESVPTAEGSLPSQAYRLRIFELQRRGSARTQTLVGETAVQVRTAHVTGLRRGGSYLATAQGHSRSGEVEFVAQEEMQVEMSTVRDSVQTSISIRSPSGAPLVGVRVGIGAEGTYPIELVSDGSGSVLYEAPASHSILVHMSDPRYVSAHATLTGGESYDFTAVPARELHAIYSGPPQSARITVTDSQGWERTFLRELRGGHLVTMSQVPTSRVDVEVQFLGAGAAEDPIRCTVPASSSSGAAGVLEISKFTVRAR